MILLVHRKASKLICVIQDGEKLPMKRMSLNDAFWHFAEQNPREIIGWCEEKFVPLLNPNSWKSIFHNDLIMVSYAIETRYLTDAIGYIDQLPFINVNQQVQYPTWIMSSNIGGIYGEVLSKFQKRFNHIRNFNFLLNSVSKLGQQNGIFCYSSPLLVKKKLLHNFLPGEVFWPDKIKATASNKEVFSFVYSHYNSLRLWLLFWCFLKYEKSFPLLALFTALFQQKYFKKNVDLSSIQVKPGRSVNQKTSIDVIIPTLGRREHLLQVLQDLKEQTLLPKKVIVVEQNPESHSQKDFPEFQTTTWPFEIVHHFIHRTGACNARNIALEEVDADWVFFADDDIRLNSDLLQQGVNELNRLGANCLNINCKQPGEETVFHKIKQWGSFGSGTSIVNAQFLKELRYDNVFEFGFGEDQDYGMQLRHAGCDIIYHPQLEIMHLKAPQGGFREMIDVPWKKDDPKPSPTLMIFAKKYYTREQLMGFKTELFLRYYFSQDIKNPKEYLKRMKERWKRSNEWAEKLIYQNTNQVLKTEMDNEF